MGVSTLWTQLINQTGKSRSLAHLAVVEGFEGNASKKRGYRLGIDTSIWLHHVVFAKGGSNPEIRALFCRLCTLCCLPIIPLFVFDGQQRPTDKRGSRKGKTGSHHLIPILKVMLDAFSIESRTAPGEAEAELAYLNQQGVIDAVLTDDVDALIFGAKTVIKNWGINLPGNKANAEHIGGPDHVMVYTAKDILEHKGVAMTPKGLILIALMSGGDYDRTGVSGIGVVTAHGLARCGFGDELVIAFEKQNEQDFARFLIEWRAKVNRELHTNSRGKLSHALPNSSLLADFPDMEVLKSYVKPIRSVLGGGGGFLRDKGMLSIPKLAAFCEAKFEDWGPSCAVIKRFRDLLWEPAVMHILRRAALEADEVEKKKRAASGNRDNRIRGPLKPSRREAVGTPPSLVEKVLSGLAAPATNRFGDVFSNQGLSTPRPLGAIPDPNPLIQKIVGTRRHASTDEMLEYRVEICPIQLVKLANLGIKKTRPGELPPRTGKPIPEPHSIMRMWIAASMLHQVHPGLVEDYTIAEEAKEYRNDQGQGQGQVKGKEREMSYHDDDDDNVDATTNFRGSSPKLAPPPKPKRKYTRRVPQAADQRGNATSSGSAQAPVPGRKRRKVAAAASHPQAGSSNPVCGPRLSSNNESALRSDGEPLTSSRIAAMLDSILEPRKNKPRTRPSLAVGGPKRKTRIAETYTSTARGSVAGSSSAIYGGRQDQSMNLSHRLPGPPLVKTYPAPLPTVVRLYDDNDVIEIDSDSEVEFLEDPVPYDAYGGGVSRMPYASSSQNSGLSYDADDVMELTDSE